MTARKQSDLGACWGLFWRCFVYVPYMLAVFIVVGGVWILRWLLPLVALFQIYSGELWAAGATFTIWFMCFWAYRHFRLAQFFEQPPSLL